MTSSSRYIAIGVFVFAICVLAASLVPSGYSFAQQENGESQVSEQAKSATVRAITRAQSESAQRPNVSKHEQRVMEDLLAAVEKKQAISNDILTPQDFSNMFFTDSEIRLVKEAIVRYQTRPKRRPRLSRKMTLPKESKVKPVLRDEVFGPPQQVITTRQGVDGDETVIIEQLPPVANVEPRDMDFDSGEFIDDFGDISLSDDLSQPEPVKEVKPGIRELRLGGILYTGNTNWIIWLNGMRVTPAALPEQVIDLKVKNEYIEIVWYDEYSELIFPIRLRPHERFNLDSRMYLPGIASR